MVSKKWFQKKKGTKKVSILFSLWFLDDSQVKKVGYSLIPSTKTTVFSSELGINLTGKEDASSDFIGELG